MPSSVIRSFVYDPAGLVLAVTFQTGRRYVYRDVPASVAEKFGQVDSKGEFFNAAIRDHYPYARTG